MKSHAFPSLSLLLVKMRSTVLIAPLISSVNSHKLVHSADKVLPFAP